MKNKEISQEEVWDALSEQWYHFRQQPFRDVNEELENFSEMKKGKILDIGAGNCRNLMNFSKRGFECYGVDFSKEMIKQAKKFCKKYDFKVKLKKARAEKLPFLKNSFDYILNMATLHHLDKTKQEKAVKEMFRVLKKNGIALIAVWKKPFGKEIKEMNVREYYLAWHIKDKTYWRYYYVFDMKELKNLFQESGFKILKEKEDKNLILLVEKL